MKTSEMIAMLEKNPKLKFVSSLGGLKSECFINDDNEIEFIKLSNRIRVDRDWQLVREPIPVWEAIKALKEGKRIKGVFKDEGEVVFEPNPPGYMYIKDILSGTWYILDEQEG